MERIFEYLTSLTHIALILLLYQHISGNKFRWYWFILLPISFKGIFLLIPPSVYFVYTFFLLFYSIFLNRYQSRVLDVFYGLYPIVIESLFGSILAFYLFPITGLDYVNFDSDNKIKFLIEILIFPFYFYLTKLVKINIENLKRGVKKHYLRRCFFLMNASMFTYLFMLQFLIIGESFIPHALEHRKHLVGIYVVVFFVLLIYLNSTFTEKLKAEVITQKEKQLKDLSVYNQHIESLYDEVRNFRHDYINILSSIQSGIELKDIEAIKDVYENVLAKTKKNFSDTRYDVANLSKINNPAIKSVISSKLLEAKNKGIQLHVEVEHKTSLANMDTLDFITILSILLDNAIEACQLVENPFLTLAVFEKNEVEFVIVENSTIQEKIDVSQIFSCDFSSKGIGRGIGLANVHNILDRYSGVSIRTHSRNYSFRQIIEMRSI